MHLTAIQINFLHRLIGDRPERRPDNAAATFFAHDQRIGSVIGRHVVYSDSDYANARKLLDNLGHYARLRPDSPRSAGNARPGLSEKPGTAAPHLNSVAIKCAAGTCIFHGESVPRTGYQVLRSSQVAEIEADRVMVVENFESFRKLEDCAWIDYGAHNTLALFRGDLQYGIDDARAALHGHSGAVWAFVDFDPAGLAIANAMPRLERVILPRTEDLKRQVLNAERSDLFAAQMDQYRRTLDESKSGPVHAAWLLMKGMSRGKALPQEWMR